MSSGILTASPSKWYKRVARFGFTAKGVVYCLSGLLAFMAAFNLGGTSSSEAGKTGVFSFIENQPFGKTLLLIVGIGLACFTLFRWIQAFKDTEHKGSGKKGFSKRFSYFFSGLVYAGLAIYAIKAYIGAGSGGGDQKQTMAREILDKPFGQWILAIAGIVMIGIGFYQVYRAVSGKYKKYISGALHTDAAKWIIRVGIAGYLARGVVWLVIGWLFIKAALHSNPREAGGSDTAFQWLEEVSYGAYLLGAVGLGLICYGIFMFLRAKYQDFHYR